MTRFRKDEDAVSTVIGALLVVALAATLFAHVQLEHVPVWEARAEERHGDAVQARLADLRASLVSGDGTSAEAGVAIPLRPASGIMGPGNPTSDRVSFDQGVSFSLNLSRFVDPNATSTETPSTWSEDWVQGSDPIEDVEEVYNFRLRIEEVGGNSPGHVRVVAKDASDRYVGNFTVRQEPDPPQSHVFIETTDGNEVVHYDNPVALHLNKKISPYWVDVMDSEYRYDGILANAAKPLTFEIQENVLRAEYTISYSETTATGETKVVGGTGEPVDVDILHAGGRIEHQVERSHLVRQQWVLEHGALILRQPDGAMFQVPPRLDLRERAGVFHLSGVLPMLEGETTGIGGAPSAQLDARPIAGQVWHGMTARLVLNITTAFPGLWTDFLARELHEAGAPAANHTLTSGTDWVRLEVGGPSADPFAPDLSVSLRVPRYQLHLGG